jgi:hypothetical protein
LNILLVVWLAARELWRVGGGTSDLRTRRLLRGHLTVATGAALVGLAQVWVIVWLLQRTIDRPSAPWLLQVIAGSSIERVALVVWLTPVAMVLATLAALCAIRRVRSLSKNW